MIGGLVVRSSSPYHFTVTKIVYNIIHNHQILTQIPICKLESLYIILQVHSFWREQYHIFSMRLSRLLHSTTSLFSSISKNASTDIMAPVTSLDLSGTKGEFKRSDAKWRNWVQDTTTLDGTFELRYRR